MLLYLSLIAKQNYSFLNVMHYVTFRSMAALLTALCISFIGGDWFIAKSRLFFRSKARPFTPESHRAKDDMPTMGGIFIIATVVIDCLLWCNIRLPYVGIFLFNLVANGALGFCDDWFKITKKKGISARSKFIGQWLIAGCTALMLMHSGISTSLSFPFFKHFTLDLGMFFVLWASFILVATSNAVNLTDGLDGLALGSLIPNFSIFSLISYLAGHFMLAYYLQIPFAACAEMAVVGATLVGACMGFLWYNAYPAQIFMGDVGSLALGSSLALLALMAKQELLLIIAGGLFVMETLSVIVQVWSFRYLGKRMFKMAPIHHHFEMLGWPETKITVRFGIISVVLCLLALMTLKIR